jgi:hypothetical protein
VNNIRTAIREKRIIRFYYNGYSRTAEPHIYGMKDGKQQILVYQTAGGSSSGRLPNWRRMEVSNLSNLIMTDQSFVGRRPTPSGRHSSFDEIYDLVN